MVIFATHFSLSSSLEPLSGNIVAIESKMIFDGPDTVVESLESGTNRRKRNNFVVVVTNFHLEELSLEYHHNLRISLTFQAKQFQKQQNSRD